MADDGISSRVREHDPFVSNRAIPRSLAVPERVRDCLGRRRLSHSCGRISQLSSRDPNCFRSPFYTTFVRVSSRLVSSRRTWQFSLEFTSTGVIRSESSPGSWRNAFVDFRLSARNTRFSHSAAIETESRESKTRTSESHD